MSGSACAMAPFRGHSAFRIPHSALACPVNSILKGIVSLSPALERQGAKGVAILRWGNTGKGPPTLKAVASRPRKPPDNTGEKRSGLPGLNQSARLLRTHTPGLAGGTALPKPRDRPELLGSSASRLAPGGFLSLFACA